MTAVTLEPNPRSPAPKKRKSGIVIPHRPKWSQRAGAWLVYSLVRSVAATVRFTLSDHSGMFQPTPGQKLVFATWHNRLALSLPIYCRYVGRHDPQRKLAAMVSASRDGGFLSYILELFGAQPVRGSSSRRGPQALREMVSLGEAGYDLAITPDGPRGPCYQVQEGVISTAQLTGMSIVPVSYYLQWKIRPRSWDRFQIPLPFTRCDVFVGAPIRVPREASEAEREQLRKHLEQTMRDMTRD